jgi:2-phosphosulfolactate phosphatase
MQRTVVIDCFQTGAAVRQPAVYQHGYTIVAIDVIRATTMAITAVALGRRCFPVTTVQQALTLARQLRHPILAGELGGNMPFGFDMSNSPAQLAMRTDVERPLILLSSSGTQLIAQSRNADAVYVSCFRNFSATARYLSGRHPKIAIIGAGSRGEFRKEDQMGCAWVAKTLVDAGHVPQDGRTHEIVQRWKNEPASACAEGNSAKYLRASGQLQDLDFILEKIDDLDAVFRLEGDEIVAAPSRPPLVADTALLARTQSALYDSNRG